MKNEVVIERFSLGKDVAILIFRFLFVLWMSLCVYAHYNFGSLYMAILSAVGVLIWVYLFVLKIMEIRIALYWKKRAREYK